MAIWTQEGNRVLLHAPHLQRQSKCYFVMPDNFKLSDVHPDLLRLCEFILIPQDKQPHKFTRQPGKGVGVAFSGGTDSSAAYCLLRDLNPHLFYLMRDGIKPTIMKHDNPLKVFSDNNIDVHCMKTNSELLRLNHAPEVGFVTDYHVSIPLILLADQYDLGCMCTGTMLGSTFLWKGYQYREFEETGHWKYWGGLFKQAGLQMFMPVMPCSEILTSSIVQQSGFQSESCARGCGKPCLKCYKCFRKQAISGIKLDSYIGTPIQGSLKQRPLKQGASMIQANNKFHLGIAELKEYETLDMSWTERYYARGIELAPERYQKHLTARLNQYADAMTSDDIDKLQHFDISGD